MPVERSESIMNLALALSKFQGELQPVPMRSTNPFLHNKYADLGAIVEVAKPTLSKYELSFSQIVFNDDAKVGVVTMLMHSSGEWMSSTLTLPTGDEKGKSFAQTVGGLITYMRRYSLSAILGIHTEEDVDGNDKKSKASAATQAEEKTPERILADKILKKLVDLGGSKNEDLVKFVKTYEPTGNPNKIKDPEKLKELYQKLTEWKQ